jgi:hypothetical protein
MQLFNLLGDLFSRPPIPFDPERQSLKAWAMYCLRDRGFKVVYAQNADFAIETKDGSKVYFKVTDGGEPTDSSVSWVVYDRTSKQIRVVPPAAT